jgi:hypothetical protein
MRPDMPDDAFVNAASYATSFEANLACSLLRSSGLESMVVNDLPGCRGPVLIRVRESEVEEARRLLTVQPSSHTRSDVHTFVRVGLVAGCTAGAVAGRMVNAVYEGALGGTIAGMGLGAVLYWIRRRL